MEKGYTLSVPDAHVLTIGQNVTLTLNGTLQQNGSLINNGTIINNSVFTADGAFTNNGIFQNNGEAVCNGKVSNTEKAEIIIDRASLTVGATLTVGKNADFDNQGMINLNIGMSAMENNGKFTNNGNVSGDGPLVNNSTVTNNGAWENSKITNSTKATFTNNAGHTVSVQVFDNQGKVVNNGSFEGKTTYEARLTNSGDLQNNNSINLRDMENTGTAANAQGATCTVNDILTNRGTFTNRGTVTVGSMAYNAGSFLNYSTWIANHNIYNGKTYWNGGETYANASIQNDGSITVASEFNNYAGIKNNGSITVSGRFISKDNSSFSGNPVRMSAQTVTYIQADGSRKQETLGEYEWPVSNILGSGKYLVDATLSSLTINGDVTLILGGDSTITGNITVKEGATLNLYTASDSTHTLQAANIEGSGRVIVNSGKVTVSEGISQITLNNGEITAGSITNGTVNKGTVTADSINQLTVTDGKITVNQAISEMTADGGEVSAESITNGTVNNGTVTADSINQLTVTGGKVTVNQTISEMTVNGGEVSAESITNGTVDKGTVTADSIKQLNVNGGKVTVGQTISEMTANGGEVSAGLINSGTVAGGTASADNAGKITVKSGTLTIRQQINKLEVDVSKYSTANVTVNGSINELTVNNGNGEISAGSIINGTVNKGTVKAGTVQQLTVNGGNITVDQSIGKLTVNGGNVTAAQSIRELTVNAGEVNADSIETLSVSSGLIKANTISKAVGISDNRGVVFADTISDLNEFKGIAFIGSSGKIYGVSQITLNTSFTIPEGSTFTVEAGKSLYILAGTVVTYLGTINIEDNAILYAVNENGLYQQGNGTIVGNLYSFDSTSKRLTTYMKPDGSTGEVYANIITKETTVLDATNGEWYVVLSEAAVVLTSRLQTNGDINLILPDDSTLSADNGIDVGNGNSLTIYGQEKGTGRLNAVGQKGNAGIGSGENGGESNITINGGTITASGYSGAGIGSSDGDYGVTRSTITINGGTITATGRFGAGIGSGYGSESTITINGGTITAKDSRGASIGSGESDGSDSKSVSKSNITINGGTITATSSSYGAGIGSGYKSESTITINGGMITAASYSGNGIGRAGALSEKSIVAVSGKAVIYTDSIDGYSTDTSQPVSITSGIVFTGTEGKVYGNPVPDSDWEIPAGYTLTIVDGQSVTIPDGVTLTNKGSIVINSGGQLTVAGALATENGTVTNAGTIQLESGTLTGTDKINNDTAGSIVRSLELTVGAAGNITYGNAYEVTYKLKDGTEAPTASAGTYHEQYTADETILTGKPENAGTYSVTVSYQTEDGIICQGSTGFTIERASAKLTVSKVEDKTVGDAAFQLEVSRKGDGALTYASSDENVLQVSGDGTVSIIGAGTATITVTLKKSTNYHADEATVTVNVKENLYKGHSLTLGDEIGVNFYMNIPENARTEGAYMEFSVSGKDGKTTKINFSDITAEKDGSYKFTCCVNAIQMAETITATYHYGENETAVNTYSVKQYVETVVASDQPDYVKNVVMALADYGYYAQCCLQEKNGWTWNQDYKEMLHYTNSMNTSVNLSDYAYKCKDSVSGIISVGTSLNLNSKTAINLYFTTDGSLTEVPTVVVKDKNGNVVNCEFLKVDDNSYRLTIPGMYAHKLGDIYTVTVNNTMIIQTSALSYAYTVLASTQTTLATKNAVVAMYQYYQATIAYREKLYSVS